MSDHLKRLRGLLAKAESEDRLAPVFVYGVTVEQLRALIAERDEAVLRLRPFARELCDDSVGGYVCACDQCRAHRFLAKTGGK